MKSIKISIIAVFLSGLSLSISGQYVNIQNQDKNELTSVLKSSVQIFVDTLRYLTIQRTGRVYQPMPYLLVLRINDYREKPLYVDYTITEILSVQRLKHITDYRGYLTDRFQNVIAVVADSNVWIKTRHLELIDHEELPGKGNIAIDTLEMLKKTGVMFKAEIGCFEYTKRKLPGNNILKFMLYNYISNVDIKKRPIRHYKNLGYITIDSVGFDDYNIRPENYHNFKMPENLMDKESFKPVKYKVRFVKKEE